MGGKVQRFTSNYGNHSLKILGWSQYQPGGSGGWIGSTTPTTQSTIRATRLVPRNSDGSRPTEWGAYAERIRAEAFDYRTEGNGYPKYRWRGEEDTTTMSRPTLPTVEPTTSTTGVTVHLPTGMSDLSNLGARNNIRNSSVNGMVALAELGETTRWLAESVADVAMSLRAAKQRKWGEAVSILLKGRDAPREVLQAKENAAKRLAEFSRSNPGSLLANAHVLARARAHERSAAKVRRGVYRRPSKGSKVSVGDALASRWLDYALVLAPTLNDVYGVVQHVNQRLRKHRIRARGVAVQTYSTADRGSGSKSSHRYGGSGVKYVSMTSYTMRISDESLYLANQLGFADPLGLAWELTTLSFVIDWFIPIGSYLSALTGSVGTEFVSGFETRVLEVDFDVEYCRYGWAGFVSGKPQRFTRQVKAMQRRTLPSLALAALPLPFFQGNGVSSVTRAFTAIALLQSSR